MLKFKFDGTNQGLNEKFTLFPLQFVKTEKLPSKHLFCIATVVALQGG